MDPDKLDLGENFVFFTLCMIGLGMFAGIGICSGILSAMTSPWCLPFAIWIESLIAVMLGRVEAMRVAAIICFVLMMLGTALGYTLYAGY